MEERCYFYWVPSETGMLVYCLGTLRNKKKSNVGKENAQRYWGFGQRRKSALHWPCIFFNLVVCHPHCVVWLVFIVGQVAFKIKKL